MQTHVLPYALRDSSIAAGEVFPALAAVAPFRKERADGDSGPR
jgi:hypothetical protein